MTLSWWLSKPNGKTYTPKQADKDEVLLHSRSMVVAFVESKVSAKQVLQNGTKLKFNGEVRWWGAAYQYAIGSPAYNVPQQIDAEMFYAFAGARMAVDGSISNVTKSSYAIRFYAKLNVTITDTYDFPDSVLRNRFLTYYAANYLEHMKNSPYKKFTHSISFFGIYKCQILVDSCQNGMMLTK